MRDMCNAGRSPGSLPEPLVASAFDALDAMSGHLERYRVLVMEGGGGADPDDLLADMHRLGGVVAKIRDGTWDGELPRLAFGAPGWEDGSGGEEGEPGWEDGCDDGMFQLDG